MNIVQIVPSLKPCGPVNVALDLTRIFTEKGYTCYVLYFDEHTEKANFNIKCIHISQYQQIPWQNIEIAHAHGYRPTKFLAKVKQNFSNVKCLLTLHNYIFDDFRYEYGKIKGYIAALMYIKAIKQVACPIVALSKDAENYYRRIFPKQKIYYSYNSREIEDLPIEKKDYEIFKSSKDNITLGIVSVLNKRKNIGSAIKSLQYLPDKYQLCIIGDGEEFVYLNKLASNLQVKHRVFFLGKKTDAYRYMKYFDVYLLPSKSEGFPLSLIEASNAGCAIVSSNLPMITEVFRNNVDIIIADVNNPSKFAGAIEMALKSKDIKQNSRSVYDKYFTLEALYERYKKIYNCIIEES